MESESLQLMASHGVILVMVAPWWWEHFSAGALWSLGANLSCSMIHTSVFLCTLISVFFMNSFWKSRFLNASHLGKFWGWDEFFFPDYCNVACRSCVKVCMLGIYSINIGIQILPPEIWCWYRRFQLVVCIKK